MSDLPTPKRFRVLASDDLPPALVAARWPCNCEEFDAPHESCGRPTKHESRWHLVEFDADAPVRVVGSDGGAPEDQLLVRDWSWVADELNAQATRLAAAEAERDAAVEKALVAERKRVRAAVEACDRFSPCIKSNGYAGMNFDVSGRYFNRAGVLAALDAKGGSDDVR